MNTDPVHPALPLGIGSYVSLTGFVGAVVSFVTAWAQNGLTPETVTLGVTAAGIIAAWFAGRSHQAASLIATGVGAYQGALDQGDQGSNTGPDGKPLGSA